MPEYAWEALVSVIDMSHVGDGCPRCGIECCHAEWVEWRRGDGSWVCGGQCDENGRHKPEPAVMACPCNMKYRVRRWKARKIYRCGKCSQVMTRDIG